MSDGQEIPEEFPKKEQHTTIVEIICHGCGAMIEEVIEGEDGWLFCHCGTGVMKVDTICMGEGE